VLGDQNRHSSHHPRTTFRRSLKTCATNRPRLHWPVGANIEGVVTDEGGGRLPRVTITITIKANGRVQVVTTGDQGNYRAVALQPAPYEIRAELSGFAVARRETTLTIGADATLDPRLALATVQENVTVTSSTPAIEVAKAQLQSIVLSDQVNTLPTLGRNFLELAQLLPARDPTTDACSISTRRSSAASRICGTASRPSSTAATWTTRSGAARP
jgi:hypothetical protein